MNENTIELEFEKIQKELNNIENKIDALKETIEVQEYNRLKETKYLLDEEKKKLYIKMKEKEFDECHHLLINNGTYCIKCGLHNLLSAYEYIEYNSLIEDDKISFDYLYGATPHKVVNKQNIDVDFEPTIANAIHKTIIKYHPQFDDEDVIKYFISAVNNMQVDSIIKDDIKKRN